MRPSAAILLAAAAATAALATSAAAGPAARWTQFTHAHSGAKANLGLARGKDGTLHVLWAGPARAPFPAIFDTPISAAGTVGAAHAVVSGWSSVQPPAAVAGPDGAVHVLISGQKVNSRTDPYAGLNEVTGPGSWSLGAHAFGNYELTVSSAADVSTAMARGGDLVSAWRSATTLLFQRGADPATKPEVITPTGDLVGNPAIAADQRSGAVVVAFDSVNSGGVFFRQVLPTLGAPVAFPKARFAGPSLAARVGGGIYSAYTPDHHKVWLLRFGGHPASVPVPKGVDVLTAGLAAGPEGRLWVFYGNAQQTYVTRTSKTVSGFEPVQTLKSPPRTLQYFRLEGEGSAGPLDLFADVTIDGATKDGSYGTHVRPQLSLAVAKTALRSRAGKLTGVRVTVRVLDAGDPIAGAKVAGLPGGPKTTDARGSAAVTIAAGKHGSLKLSAARAGYLSAKARASF